MFSSFLKESSDSKQALLRLLVDVKGLGPSYHYLCLIDV